MVILSFTNVTSRRNARSSVYCEPGSNAHIGTPSGQGVKYRDCRNEIGTKAHIGTLSGQGVKYRDCPDEIGTVGKYVNYTHGGKYWEQSVHSLCPVSFASTTSTSEYGHHSLGKDCNSQRTRQWTRPLRDSSARRSNSLYSWASTTWNIQGMLLFYTRKRSNRRCRPATGPIRTRGVSNYAAFF